MVRKARQAVTCALCLVIASSFFWTTSALASPQTAVLTAINQARARVGAPPVALSTQLHRIALGHSDSMVSLGYFAHSSPSGVGVHDRIVRSGFVTGYSWYAGEILAYGYTRAKAVVAAWLRSPEHRAILLTPRFRWIGAGRAFAGTTAYWTVDFVDRF